MTRALVLGRRRPGRPIGPATRQVTSDLRAAGWTVEREVVDRKRDLRRRAADAVKDRVDVVVAVGGDGAVGQIATELAGTDLRLAVVPTGTGNLLAANLRIPLDPGKATRVVLDGRPRRIDVGFAEVGDRRRAFTVACGIGFDAQVMDATERRQKVRWGKLAYLANALLLSGDIGNVLHRIRLDGETTEIEAAQVFVANFGRMLPLLTPRPRIRPDDGLLDVVVVTASGPVLALLAAWEATTQGDLGSSRGGHVFRARAREVRIEPDGERLVELDGSIVGTTPIEVSVMPRALSVLVPAR